MQSPKNDKARECGPCWIGGAEGGTRTHTLLRAADFESAASTDSATSACCHAARLRSIAMVRHRHHDAWAVSGDFVGREFARGAAVPLAVLRHEHGAAFHRRLVDVQRDGDGVGTGVADAVVLVRWDQAPGAARAGLHSAGGPEPET